MQTQQWQYMCDGNWTPRNSHVLCRQFGYKMGQKRSQWFYFSTALNFRCRSNAEHSTGRFHNRRVFFSIHFALRRRRNINWSLLKIGSGTRNPLYSSSLRRMSRTAIAKWSVSFRKQSHDWIVLAWVLLCLQKWRKVSGKTNRKYSSGHDRTQSIKQRSIVLIWVLSVHFFAHFCKHRKYSSEHDRAQSMKQRSIVLIWVLSVHFFAHFCKHKSTPVSTIQRPSLVVYLNIFSHLQTSSPSNHCSLTSISPTPSTASMLSTVTCPSWAMSSCDEAPATDLR